MKRLILVLLLFTISCKESSSRSDAPSRIPEPAPDSEVVMTPVPPPAEPPAPINPRIKEPSFFVDEKTVEIVRLPAGDGPVQYVLAGRFDGSQKTQLAYVMADRIQFRAIDGAALATVQHTGFPRLVRLIFGPRTGPDRVLVGWGRNPAGRSAEDRISFTVTDVSGRTPEKKLTGVHEIIHQTTSQRADPQDAVVTSDGSIYLAWFSDKYTVQVARRAASGGEVQKLVTASMIGRLAVIPAAAGDPQVFVARVYGDEPGSSGGLYQLVGTQLKPLPTVRGVRGLWAGQNKDGLELWVGDGWDKDYGKVARAFLSMITIQGEKVERRQVAELTAGYSVMSIAPCDWYGPQKPGFVIKTNNQLLWIDQAAAAAPVVIAQWGSLADPVVVDLDGDRKQEILIVSGEPILLKARK